MGHLLSTRAAHSAHYTAFPPRASLPSHAPTLCGCGSSSSIPSVALPGFRVTADTPCTAKPSSTVEAGERDQAVVARKAAPTKLVGTSASCGQRQKGTRYWQPG
eukprot:1161860-Pelagomonas_calceolata.AAC.1